MAGVQAVNVSNIAYQPQPEVTNTENQTKPTTNNVSPTNGEAALANLEQQGLDTQFSLNQKLDQTGGVFQLASAGSEQTQKTNLPAQATTPPDKGLGRRVEQQVDQEKAIGANDNSNSAIARNSVPKGTYTATTNVKQVLPVTYANPIPIIPLKSEEQAKLAKSVNLNKQITLLNKEEKEIKLQIKSLPNGKQKSELNLRLNKITNEKKSLRQQVLNLGDLGELRNRERLSSSANYNGKIFTAISDGANPKAKPVIFSNGVNTDVARSGTEALEVSKLANAPVQHVVNVSSMDRGKAKAAKAIEGSLADVESASAKQVKTTASNPPAATAVANAILTQLNDGSNDPIKVVGYSQGTAINAKALEMVDAEIEKRNITPEAKAKLRNRIQVLGIGAAASHRDIPENFKRNYRLIYDKNDQIVKLRGTGEGGKTPNFGDVLRTKGNTEGAGGFSEHLSYFRHYEATDRSGGAEDKAGRPVKYNPQAGKEIKNWLDNPKGGTAVEIDQRKDQENLRNKKNMGQVNYPYTTKTIPASNILGVDWVKPEGGRGRRVK
jgi:hypothetical protein